MKSAAEHEFADTGYLVLPGFLSESQTATLKAEIDQYVETWGDDGIHQTRPFALNYEACSRLATEPRLMSYLDAIMRGPFALHHLHVAKHRVNDPGVTWHHDYEQIPQTNRDHTMVHVFFYLNKLDGTIGDLQLIPGSHKTIVARGAIGDVFGFAALPGMIVVNDAPAGTAVILHSAIWHARKPKPGGSDQPRYFIDISYCQSGTIWPNEKIWISEPHNAVERGWVTPGREWVMDRTSFVECAAMQARLVGRTGSLSMQL